MRGVPKTCNLILCILVSLLVWGCEDTCNENRNALPLAGFYKVDADGRPESCRIDSLAVRGVGAPGDSVLSPASETKSQLYLPFRIDTDRTTYVFADAHKGSQLRDTVTFDYTRVARFASAECGVSYVFHVHDITWHGRLIDSVVCPKGFIDNDNVENLKIYFRSR